MENKNLDKEESSPKSVKKHGLIALISLLVTILLIILGILYFLYFRT